MHRYKQLKIWQKAMNLTTLVYRYTQEFPDTERFSLLSQIRRSAVSIPSNIAEGAGRESALDFKRFLHIANGSANELETQLIIAGRLGYCSSQQVAELVELIDEIQRMNFSLTQTLSD